MDKEQEKELVWNQIQAKKEEIKQHEKKLEMLNKELENLQRKYTYLNAADDLKIIF